MLIKEREVIRKQLKTTKNLALFARENHVQTQYEAAGV
jgi:hypothetical protein